LELIRNCGEVDALVVNPFGTFEDCAIEPLTLEGLRRGKSGNSRSDYSNARFQFHLSLSNP